METHLADFIRDTPAGLEAESILRRCVHCGFCNATCPTYQLLGDELDGPRGRIYLIKQALEGARPTEKTRLHLDRCLTCRACETTCPSGVEYTRLLNIGRQVVEGQVPRRGWDAVWRRGLRWALPRPGLVAAAVRLGQQLRPVLPRHWQARIPQRIPANTNSPPSSARRFIMLAGCVQSSLAPNINAAARRVLNHLGIDLIEAPEAGCCGALRHHLNDPMGACEDARRNLAAWWPLLEAGAEGLAMTASGCGAHILEYARLLQNDSRFSDRAKQLTHVTRDISTIIAEEASTLEMLLKRCPPLPESRRTLAFHSPCTLQHGFKIHGLVEPLLEAAGFRLTSVRDAHLCCGSAGTYSILQPELSGRLRERKLAALLTDTPSVIASANVGCMTHLQAASPIPVHHWIELIDQRLALINQTPPRRLSLTAKTSSVQP